MVAEPSCASEAKLPHWKGANREHFMQEPLSDHRTIPPDTSKRRAGMSMAEAMGLLMVLITTALGVGNLIFQAIPHRRNPPIGRFVQCDGMRLHYIDRGDSRAPCVVLLHGNGTMIQDLTISGLVDRLARHSRVVCFDRPGFGHSPRPRSKICTPSAQAELLVVALNKLGVREPVIFGHSWGTLVALALALRKD